MVFLEKKKWYESKTLQLNILAVIAGVALWVSGQIEMGLPITISGVLNALLRLITKTQIE